MPALIDLWLDGNQITDQGLERISQSMPNLEVLKIRSTAVTDLAWPYLKSLKKLTNLDLLKKASLRLKKNDQE